MARTTAELVKEVLAPGGDYNLRTNPSLTVFINSASVLVNKVISLAANNEEEGLTTDQAQLVETWLAAHMYCMSDQTYASKSTAGASASFHGQTGLKLDATKYGQMAKVIDTTGYLTSLSENLSASMTWLGKPVSEQIAYEERD